MSTWTRRNVLKGMLHGSAMTVGIPLLDLFLDGNGEAMASGAPLPTRYGTWFWGCGINEKRFFPTAYGRDFQMNVETMPLAPLKDKISIFSNFNVILGSKPNLVHWSGIMGTLTGVAPTSGGQNGGAAPAPTLDCIISDAIGGNSRFRSLEVACTGSAGVSYSMRKGSTVNPSEVDPVSLYKRIFGPEFKDPNKAEFKPDPAVMLRQSVLSSVKEDRDDLMKTLGASDKQRVDQYFTSVRQMEEQLGHMLEKPAPAEACAIPREGRSQDLGPTIDVAMKAHDVLGQLVVMALACNQTRVFNVALSSAGSNLRKPGDPVSFHELTHEEPVDPKLGVQPKSTFFIENSMVSLGSMLKMMDSVKEGAGTLLDNSLVLATSETNFAKVHSVDSLPVVVAGRAGGRWKSGIHVNGKGDATSRVGLTIQQVMGLPVDSWGENTMYTNKPIAEVMA